MLPEWTLLQLMSKSPVWSLQETESCPLTNCETIAGKECSDQSVQSACQCFSCPVAALDFCDVLFLDCGVGLGLCLFIV
jgi:hypothetical protein